MNSEYELLTKVKENFLAERARQELLLATWAEKIEKVDPELLRDVSLPEDLSLKGIMPELYKEHPDKAVYEQQYLAWQQLSEKVNKIAEAYNEEAKRCLSEYQQLCSKIKS